MTDIGTIEHLKARVEKAEKALRLVQQHADTAWNRGWRHGQRGVDLAIKQAAEAKESYLNENQRLTNLLLLTEEKIAAKDALIAKLQCTLEVIDLRPWHSQVGAMASDAIALPNDDTALRELIAKERKAALLEAAEWFHRTFHYEPLGPEDVIRTLAEEQGAKP